MQAFWIEKGDDSTTPVNLRINQEFLEISVPGNRILRWPLKEISVSMLPGSSDKWFLHEQSRPFPRLLTNEPLPGIPGMKTSSPEKFVAFSCLSLAAILSSMTLLFVFAVWKGLPLLADAAAEKLSPSIEKEITGSLRKEVLSSLEINRSKSLIMNQLAQDFEFGEKDNVGMGRPEFLLAEKEEFNAFALPGGTVVVFSGALDKIENLPELMALLGHENGHVQGRHSIRTLVRSMGLYALLSFVAGDVGGLATVLAENARDLQSLSYSRDFEREADEAAMQFLCRNETDPRGMVSLMERMDKLGNQAGSELPGFLSSHPLTAERLNTARNHSSISACRFRSNQKADSLFKLLKQH
jgi:predicted Zn-dependent protease